MTKEKGALNMQKTATEAAAVKPAGKEEKTFRFNFEIHCHLTDNVKRGLWAEYKAESLGEAFEQFKADKKDYITEYYIDDEPTFEASDYADAKRRADEAALDLEDIATPEEIKIWNDDMSNITMMMEVM